MVMPMMNDCYSPSVKSNKLKSSICCFCSHDDHDILQSNNDRKPHMLRSPYAQLKSMTQELEIKDMCLGLIGRKGKNWKHNHSFDFRYNPTSYSFNFEDDNNEEDELPLNNFTSRLPPGLKSLPRDKWVASPPVVIILRSEFSFVELINIYYKIKVLVFGFYRFGVIIIYTSILSVVLVYIQQFNAFM